MIDRLSCLRERLAAQGLDGLLITNLLNVRYLCGFTGSAGALLATAGDAVFFSDGRYREQAVAQVTGCRLDIGLAGKTIERVGAVVAELGVRALGIETASITLEQYQKYCDQLPATNLVPTSGVVESLRLVKDAGELAALERAAAINDRVVEVACASLREGLSERRLARTIRDAIEALGGEAEAFETIVLFGARASLPHGRPGDAVLRYGDIVLMDFGARVDGYHGDCTRTVAFGEAPEGFAERYAAVLAAQQAVTAAARPGLTGHELDAVARQCLIDAGYGEQFMHGTGHGVGLEIHEGPRLGPESEHVLAAGHVVTNEPGLYIAGWGGIRIEDMLLIEADGARRLTQSPLELRVV